MRLLLDKVGEDNARFRRALPADFLSGQMLSRERIELVKQHVDALAETDTEAIRRSLMESVLANHVLPQGAGAGLFEGVTHIDLSARYEIWPNLPAYLLPGDSGACLAFAGKKVIFPSFAEPILQFIMKERRFTGDALPGDLDEDERRVLIGRLWREGLIRATPRPESGMAAPLA